MFKKILFLTGTRADFGKMHPLMDEIEKHDDFECNIFVTGMHMLSKYGSTYREVEKKGYDNIYKYINQSNETSMDKILSNTVRGFSNYVNEINPDLIIVHGDRVEALAGATVGALNNTLVAHIEGGEVSGTIDEHIRHSITKLAHVHFVANEEAKRRVGQLGEKKKNIFIIGSPDIDVMLDKNIPTLETAVNRYEIPFNNFALLLYHPVTTKIEDLEWHIKEVIDAVLSSERKYIVIHPNNDKGSRKILDEYKRLETNSDFKLFPSLRFEFFLTFLKHAEFIIGNSSAGVREAEIYGTPSINIGSRQNNRNNSDNIINVPHEKGKILSAINKAENKEVSPDFKFGSGNSREKFIKVLTGGSLWDLTPQKTFVDIDEI